MGEVRGFGGSTGCPECKVVSIGKKEEKESRIGLSVYRLFSRSQAKDHGLPTVQRCCFPSDFLPEPLYRFRCIFAAQTLPTGGYPFNYNIDTVMTTVK